MGHTRLYRRQLLFSNQVTKTLFHVFVFLVVAWSMTGKTDLFTTFFQVFTPPQDHMMFKIGTLVMTFDQFTYSVIVHILLTIL